MTIEGTMRSPTHCPNCNSVPCYCVMCRHCHTTKRAHWSAYCLPCGEKVVAAQKKRKRLAKRLAELRARQEARARFLEPYMLLPVRVGVESWLSLFEEPPL